MNNVTKPHDSFHPRPESGRMHRVTIDIWLPGNPGEIAVIRHAEFAAQMMASRGMMPTRVHSISRQILDTTLEELIRE